MGDNIIRREIKIEAQCDKLNTLQDILREDLEKMGCPMDRQMTLEICVEEVFVNIASYAYGEETGEAFILEEIRPNDIMLCFKDRGIPYNPLEKEDPDTTLSVEERKIGGLGVYMVKTMMDSVSYEYRDNCNCLTMTMSW